MDRKSILMGRMQKLFDWVNGAIEWVYLRLLRGSLVLSGGFFVISVTLFLFLNFLALQQKNVRSDFEGNLRLWRQKGLTMALSSSSFEELQQWNRSLGKRFNGRLAQEISRDHSLFRETPYRLNGSLLVDYKELETLIGIFSVSDNGKQNGSLLLTKFTIKRLGEDSRVSYGFIARNSK